MMQSVQVACEEDTINNFFSPSKDSVCFGKSWNNNKSAMEKKIILSLTKSFHTAMEFDRPGERSPENVGP